MVFLKNMQKEERKITIFLVYTMVIYTFVQGAFSGTGIICNLSKVLFALLFFLCIKKHEFKIDAVSMLMLVFAIYMLCSLIISSAINDLTVDIFFKEVMYELLPILLFVFSRNYKLNKVYKTYIISCITLIILGIPVFFGTVPVPILAEAYSNIRNSAIATGFGSYIGVIGMGYLSQLAFATILFKKINTKLNLFFIVFFFVFSLFTLQRSALLGLIIAVFISLFQRKNNGKSILKYIVLLLVVLFSFKLIINGFGSNLFPYSMNEYIQSMLQEFDIKSAINGRSDQLINYNSSVANVMFGHGMGSFSPNNPNAVQNISDACYYRIYNEMGIFGLFLFISPFVVILIRAFKRHNFYLIYLVLFSLISFYFNRTIWSIPSAYVYYLFVAVETNISRCYEVEVGYE